MTVLPQSVLPQPFFTAAPSRPALIGLAALTRKAMRGEDLGRSREA